MKNKIIKKGYIVKMIDDGLESFLTKDFIFSNNFSDVMIFSSKESISFLCAFGIAAEMAEGIKIIEEIFYKDDKYKKTIHLEDLNIIFNSIDDAVFWLMAKKNKKASLYNSLRVNMHKHLSKNPQNKTIYGYKFTWVREGN